MKRASGMTPTEISGELRVLERSLRRTREPIPCDLVDRVTTALEVGDSATCPAAVARMVEVLRTVAQGIGSSVQAKQRNVAARLLCALREWRRLKRERERRAS